MLFFLPHPVMFCTDFCTLLPNNKGRWILSASYNVTRQTSMIRNLLWAGWILSTQQLCSSQTLRGVLVRKTPWWCGISFEGSWKHAVVNPPGSVAGGEATHKTHTLSTLSVLLEVCSNTQQTCKYRGGSKRGGEGREDKERGEEKFHITSPAAVDRHVFIN